jgi:hypothetical protein
MSMDHYYLLGRSGLRVSQLALGTMNFGTSGFHAPYGKTEDEARAVFRRYLDAGGNFRRPERRRERPQAHGRGGRGVVAPAPYRLH